MIPMFEIKSPNKFLKQLIIVEFLLGLGLVALGSFLLIDLYVYIYINQGFYKYALSSSIFLIILIITGLCKFCSFLLLKKSNYRGIEISMISLLLLTGNFVYLSIDIFAFNLMRAYTGAELAVYSAQFGLTCIAILVSIYVFLIIFKNKENLKKYI